MTRSTSFAALLAFAFQLQSFRAVPAEPASVATVGEVATETVKGETFFRVTVNWPAQGVAYSYGEFLGPESPEVSEYYWPPDSLALIPQDDAASLVFREFTAPSEQREVSPWSAENSLSSPVTFLGKVAKGKSAEFLFRCPNPDHKFITFPLKVDFSKAKPAKGLLKEWVRAEADFTALYPAPIDVSFLAYAHERLTARLGKESARTVPWNPRGSGRTGLYDITTGSMALQESLQLDRMRNATPDKGERKYALDQIPGVTVASHPWDQMIGGKKPEIEPIAALVPEDQYYVRFRTIKAMKNFLDFLQQWGGMALSEVELGGRDYGAQQKIETQICLKTSWLSELLGEAVVDSLAITGSDPYMREGTDLTMIFRLKSETLFSAAVGRYLDATRKEHADLKEDKQAYQGAEIESYVTPDAAVRCHRAKLGEYMVYSNSPVGIRRVIDAWKGKLPAIAAAKDFVFMRTLYPLGAPEEDGFVYLSDPFLRALTGPKLRILEKRRLETVTTLEMVRNAALFYLWEHPGAKVPTLDQMSASGAVDPKHLFLEPGDKLSWDPAAFEARSARYGTTGRLTPNVELAIGKVTDQEKQEYERFRQNYQDYWRQYFDPIGIRITSRDRVALAVTILPLIDNSEYNHTKALIGGKAVELEPVPRGDKVLVHLATHLNPQSEDYQRMQNVAINLFPNHDRATVEWLGERFEFWMEDSDVLQKAIAEEKFGDIFRIPMVAGIEVKSPLGLTAFLIAFKAMVDTSAPNMVVFEPTERYRDFTFTRLRAGAQATANDEFKDASLYYGAVGNMFYLSTSLPSLQRVVDGVLAQKDPNVVKKAAGDLFGAANQGHLALRLTLKDMKSIVPLLQRQLGREALRAEREHLRALWLAARTAGWGNKASLPPEKVLGYSIVSALGNSYSYDASKDEVRGSQSGTIWDLKVPNPFPERSPIDLLIKSVQSLRGTLEFTKDGLHTELSVQRK